MRVVVLCCFVFLAVVVLARHLSSKDFGDELKYIKVQEQLVVDGFYSPTSDEFAAYKKFTACGHELLDVVTEGCKRVCFKDDDAITESFSECCTDGCSPARALHVFCC